MNRFVTIRNSLLFWACTTGEPGVSVPGPCPAIGEGTIHVWSAQYSTLERYYPFLSGLISPEETMTAGGFKKPEDKRRYILRHGLVRAVLGDYIHEDPEKIRFIQKGCGKPELDVKGTCPDIRFSLSRTDETVCLGLVRRSAIGLDIVKADSRHPFSEIGQYLFTGGERAWIAQAAPYLASIRFFRIWALKEALLKATGGDVRVMKDADVSGIMTDTFLHGRYTIQMGKTDLQFFIHEACGNHRHHCAIAASIGR
jgi:4'-phosphopantetheinyl transferase